MEQEIGEETEEEMYSSQHYVTTISGQVNIAFNYVVELKCHVR